MNKKFNAVLFLALICFAYSGYSTTCSQDTDCPAGQFCDEKNQSSGLPQCSIVDTTGCNALDLSCTSISDCVSKYGSSWCDTNKGICYLIGNMESGEPCQLDKDCFANNPTGYGHCFNGFCSGSYFTGTYYKKCSTTSDCIHTSLYYCDTTYNICTSRQKLGGYCNSNSECFTSYYGMSLTCDTINHICVGCTSETDDNATHYCDLTHSDTCPTSGNFYGSYAENHSLNTPIMVPKGEEGDACTRHGCCVSSDCVDGHCVKAGGYHFSNTSMNTSQSRLCRNLTNINLATQYFDGVTYGSPGIPYSETALYAVNINNINVLLTGNSGSDIRPIRGNTISPNVMFWGRYRGPSSYSPRTVMFGYFYSNSTGDMYYVHQRDTTILSAKFPACLAAGLAIGAYNGTTYKLGAIRLIGLPSFSCISEDGSVAIQGRDIYSIRYGMIAITGFTTTHAEVLSMALSIYLGLNDHAGIRYTTTGNLYNRIIESSGTAAPAVYPFGWCGPGDNPCILTTTQSMSSITGYVIDDDPFSLWTMGSITTYLDLPDFEEADCCASASDCALGYCCNPYSLLCDFCPELPQGILILTPVPSIIPEGGKSRVTAKLTVSGAPIYHAIILFNQSGTCGVTGNVQCMTDSSGQCYTDVTAGSCTGTTGYILIGARTGPTDEYGFLTAYANITVNNNSNYLRLFVFDIRWPLISLNGASVYCSLLTPTTKYISGLIVEWTFLPATPSTYLCTFSKEGYKTADWIVPINQIVGIPMFRSNESETGTLEPPLPNIALNETIPQSGSEVTGGLNQLLRTMMGLFFPWFFLIMLFLIAIGIISMLLHKSTDIL